MPPYICTPEEIEQITSAMVGVAACVNLNTVQVDGTGQGAVGDARRSFAAGLARRGRAAAARRRAAPVAAHPPAGRRRARPGLQRLPRPVAAPRRDRRRRRGAAHLGCGLDRIAAGHRQHRTARGLRGRAGRFRRRRVGAGVLVGLHRQPRCGGRVVRPGIAAGVRRATRTRRWSTPAGCRGPGWW